MSDFAALDVAIGLIFLILLVSSLCSIAQEAVASTLNWRGKDLRQKIGVMLNDPGFSGLGHMVMSNPRIQALYSDKRWPSYIPSRAFAQALVDIVLDRKLFDSSSVSGPLAPFLKTASGDAQALQGHFETWFDDAMDRLTGQYRRKAQTMLLVFGFLLAVLLNVDMIAAARTLWSDPSLRAAIVQGAAAVEQKGEPELDQLRTQIESTTLPIGWNAKPRANLFSTPDLGARAENWLFALVGWLMTAFAASLGGHFWFNVLGGALSLRSAGSKPPTAAELNIPAPD